MSEDPARGWCSTCRTEVEIDGPAGNEEGTLWSHVVIAVEMTTEPGHAEGCDGDCGRYGCPVPVPAQEQVQRLCGPVFPGVDDLLDEMRNDEAGGAGVSW